MWRSAANGKGMVSTGFEGSGWTPFRELNLATDTLTQRSDAGSVFGQVRQNTHIHRSSDRSLFFMTESNISSGPIFTYNATTDTFPNRAETNTSHDSILSAGQSQRCLNCFRVRGWHFYPKPKPQRNYHPQ
jgi:hypothetical protein